jgi:hypothetical protein
LLRSEPGPLLCAPPSRWNGGAPRQAGFTFAAGPRCELPAARLSLSPSPLLISRGASSTFVGGRGGRIDDQLQGVRDDDLVVVECVRVVLQEVCLTVPQDQTRGGRLSRPATLAAAPTPGPALAPTLASVPTAPQALARLLATLGSDGWRSPCAYAYTARHAGRSYAYAYTARRDRHHLRLRLRLSRTGRVRGIALRGWWQGRGGRILCYGGVQKTSNARPCREAAKGKVTF